MESDLTVNSTQYMGYFRIVASGCIAFFPIDNYTLNNYNINITSVEIWGVSKITNYKVET